jgi:hypothetical protein
MYCFYNYVFLFVDIHRYDELNILFLVIKSGDQ